VRERERGGEGEMEILGLLLLMQSLLLLFYFDNQINQPCTVFAGYVAAKPDNSPPPLFVIILTLTENLSGPRGFFVTHILLESYEPMVR